MPATGILRQTSSQNYFYKQLHFLVSTDLTNNGTKYIISEKDYIPINRLDGLLNMSNDSTMGLATYSSIYNKSINYSGNVRRRWNFVIPNNYLFLQEGDILGITLVSKSLTIGTTTSIGITPGRFRVGVVVNGLERYHEIVGPPASSGYLTLYNKVLASSGSVSGLNNYCFLELDMVGYGASNFSIINPIIYISVNRKV